MTDVLTKLTLSTSLHPVGIPGQSFNNDSQRDKTRNSFFKSIPSSSSRIRNEEDIPSDFLRPNIYRHDSSEIFKSGDRIIVGEYCNDGVVVPLAHSIVFDQLYNCTPLISLIKGDEEYISFLHTWAIEDEPRVVDKQVKHWMETLAEFGDISETVFAPRKNGYCSDTAYKSAIDDMVAASRKTIILERGIEEISGVVNGRGVYFEECGYHLWGG